MFLSQANFSEPGTAWDIAFSPLKFDTFSLLVRSPQLDLMELKAYKDPHLIYSMPKNKHVVVSTETWGLLVARAGELQAKTGRRVFFDDVIQVALRLLDIEAAARLVHEGSEEKRGRDTGDKSEAADPTTGEDGGGAVVAPQGGLHYD